MAQRSNQQRRLYLVGAALRAVREARGISLKRFAEDVGVSHVFMVRMELHGAQPGMPLLVRIADRLAMSVDDLTIDLAKVPTLPTVKQEAAS
jgi:transcriptional regulator with XRE-family HTH domain